MSGKKEMDPNPILSSLNPSVVVDTETADEGVILMIVNHEVGSGEGHEVGGAGGAGTHSRRRRRRRRTLVGGRGRHDNNNKDVKKRRRIQR